MIQYTVYEKSSGKILRYGQCADRDYELQVNNENEGIIKGLGEDLKKKVVDGKLVNKTLEEIETDKSPERMSTPIEKQRANITNEQLISILSRLEQLENK